MKKQTLTFSIIPFFVLIVLLMKGTLNDQQSFPHLEFWAYHWRIPISEKDSSYKFILDYYIEIDSSKSCRVVRRSIDHYPNVVFEYFRLNLPDSIVQYIFHELG